jgi:streptothricin acetyltransferase
MQILPLTNLHADDLHRLIAGYTSPARYRVQRTESDELTSFTLELETLDTPYVKPYEPIDDDTLERYQGYAKNEFSLGAYEGDQLIALALAEQQHWNNTLWVWEFHIAKSHQGQGIGSRLMEAVAERGRAAGIRAIFCETQSTNVPAIRFYRKVGFTLDGINLSFYTNDDWPNGEIALFMKWKL